MAHLTKKSVYLKKDNETFILSLKVNVSTDGKFTSNVGKEYLAAIKGVFKSHHKVNKETITIMGDSLNELLDLAKKVLDVHNTPIVTVENIIAYNIKSDVSFCEDAEGNIYPNGYYEKDLSWADGTKYGDHSASSRAEDGYSLKIGAVAYTKTTKDYNGNLSVSFDRYYGENGWHLNINNPAEKLNSWCSFYINPQHCRQIPYSDKSALFFFNLLMGMAKMSKLIQDATFDEENLMVLIESGGNPMLPNHNRSIEDVNK